MPDHPDFRWRAFFRRSHEPLFLLNRGRRILFVNQAFEKLTEVTAAQVRGLTCTRRQSASPSEHEWLTRLLCPPLEVMKGGLGQVRRLYTARGKSRAWWDIDFFPLKDEQGLLAVLGKIAVLPLDQPADIIPLPEKLMALRIAAASRYGLDRLSGEAPAFARIVDQVILGSQTHANVLIQGEAGTGKSWVARTIHYAGSTREQTFLRLDCQYLPPGYLSKVLFDNGNDSGFARAGTIYLREPAHLPRDIQAHLCVLLNEKRDKEPRVIAGVSTDLKADVGVGRMLGELHARLSTLTIGLPPLRDRTDDFSHWVEQFLERANSWNDGHSAIKKLSNESWELLRMHRWPGNLRELYDVLGHARRHCAEEPIQAKDLPLEIRVADLAVQKGKRAPDRKFPLDQLLEQAERRLIELALQLGKGNKSRAAEILSIWRPRLIRRMEALGIADKGSKDESV